MTRELTGRHVLGIVLTAFAIIIAVNLTMLFAATGSFPGLVVKNSYVAGVGWDARASAQRNLGWTADVTYTPGTLRIALTDRDGHPVAGATPVLTIGRPTTAARDYSAEAQFDGTAYTVPADLAAGRWRIDLTTDRPEAFATTVEVWIAGID